MINLLAVPGSQQRALTVCCRLCPNELGTRTFALPFETRDGLVSDSDLFAPEVEKLYFLKLSLSVGFPYSLMTAACAGKYLRG